MPQTEKARLRRSMFLPPAMARTAPGPVGTGPSGVPFRSTGVSAPGSIPPRRSGGGRTCGGWAVGRLGVGGWRCAELFQVKQNQDILVHWYLLTSYSYVVKPGGGNWM